MPWEGGGRSVLDRIVALRSAVRTMGGVFGGAEAIPVVETTTRSLRNVPKGKELVHQLPKKEGRIRKIRSFGHGQTVVRYRHGGLPRPPSMAAQRRPCGLVTRKATRCLLTP